LAAIDEERLPRDTVVDAGLANEGWRQVLSARGIDCRDW
jgi:hypothetical protein